MKKYIALLASFIMVCFLCACGNSGAEETRPAAVEGLQVGYARMNITPDYEVGLGGYSDAESRKQQGYIEYIYATCIAATSGAETILMYTIDNCAVTRELADTFREAITAKTGIAGEKIFIGATHAHNCPSFNGGYENLKKYTEDVANWCAEAGEKALADRSSAKLLRAKAEHEGMNFVRHYTLDDGTYTDSNGAARAGATRLVGHPMPTDPQMVMLKFDREEGKKDILMVNWQAHPDSATAIGYNLISPSWIGPMRSKLEKDTGMDVAYFTGASGNQVMESQIPTENHGYSWKKYGEALADCAYSMLDKLEPVEGETIKTNRYIMDVDVDHSWDHMLEQAKEVYDLWKKTDRPTGDVLAKTYNMSSVYHARAIISRASMDKTLQMEMNTFCIGDVGFTTGTYEMFSNSGLYVKENSPFETTFLITGNSSYIPADIAYTYRGYEADTGYYARGTAEALAEQYVQMLKTIK